MKKNISGYVTWSEFPCDFFVKYIHACHYCSKNAILNGTFHSRTKCHIKGQSDSFLGLSIYRRFTILSMIRTLIAIMAARIIVGNRGGKVLIYKGFKYQKNRKRASAIYWRCWRQECRANLRTCTFNI
jgi:hypothetical protein